MPWVILRYEYGFENMKLRIWILPADPKARIPFVWYAIVKFENSKWLQKLQYYSGHISRPGFFSLHSVINSLTVDTMFSAIAQSKCPRTTAGIVTYVGASQQAMERVGRNDLKSLHHLRAASCRISKKKNLVSGFIFCPLLVAGSLIKLSRLCFYLCFHTEFHLPMINCCPHSQ